jgi:methionine-rich copper-binding protein CopC
MRLVRYGLAAALSVGLLAPSLVLAHADLVSTSPADGENLDEAPDEVVMVFESEIDPHGSEFTVTDADGNVVGEGAADLEVAERNEMRGDLQIDEPGVFTVAWTSVAADGFVANGTFRFGYQADPGAAPNTATSPAADWRLILAGAALLILAAFRSPTATRRRGQAA